MGRLFWKSFLAFWLALLLAGAGVGVAVWLHQHSEQDAGAVLLGGQRASFAMRMAGATLRHAGPEALRELMQESENRPEGRPPGVRLMVVDEAGRDLLGRPVDPEVLAAARLAPTPRRPGAGMGGAPYPERAPDGSVWLLSAQADQQP